MAYELSGLYPITPETNDRTYLLHLVSAVLPAVSLIQYRDKTSGKAERFARAQALLKICRSKDVLLIINDDVELALSINADGVHIGASDGDLYTTRQLLDNSGQKKILGVSCYADLKRAESAVNAGADYLAFGAVFPSPSKPTAPCIPPHFFSQINHLFQVPICAIGGINIMNARILIESGVDLLAMINDIFSSDNIIDRAYEYKQMFKAAYRRKNLSHGDS